jgi:hypothetical protein
MSVFRVVDVGGVGVGGFWRHYEVITKNEIHSNPAWDQALVLTSFSA